jgi:hypothetical protein
VTYLSVLNLILLGVSAGYQEWTYGGVEYDPLAALPPSVSALDEAMLSPAGRAALGAPKLGATVQRWFTLGLSRSYFEGVRCARRAGRGSRGHGGGGGGCRSPARSLT